MVDGPADGTPWTSYRPRLMRRRQQVHPYGWRHVYMPVVARRVDGHWEHADTSGHCAHRHVKQGMAQECGDRMARQLNRSAMVA